jgi:hypothetical protein
MPTDTGRDDVNHHATIGLGISQLVHIGDDCGMCIIRTAAVDLRFLHHPCAH